MGYLADYSIDVTDYTLNRLQYSVNIILDPLGNPKRGVTGFIVLYASLRWSGPTLRYL